MPDRQVSQSRIATELKKQTIRLAAAIPKFDLNWHQQKEERQPKSPGCHSPCLSELNKSRQSPSASTNRPSTPLSTLNNERPSTPPSALDKSRQSPKLTTSTNEQSPHFSVLNKICSDEWTKVATQVKECITAPSTPHARPETLKTPQPISRKASNISLPIMSSERFRTSVTPNCSKKNSMESGLKRSLSENSKTSHRVQSVNNSTGTLTGAVLDVLTPFQAVIGLKREDPAYWISSEYIYNPMFQQLDLTVRQTGVLPETINPRTKLVLQISCYQDPEAANKLVKKIVVRRSGNDTTFKSGKVNFYVSNRADVREYNLNFQIFSRSLLRKKKIAEWDMPLSDCTFTDVKSYLTKVNFIQ